MKRRSANRQQQKTARIITESSQAFSFSRRSALLGGAQMTVGALLCARMGWISIAQNDKYSLLSESNRVNMTLVPPQRGWIVDRYDKPLANNRTDFRVDIIPDRLHDKDRVIAELSQLLTLTPDNAARIREDLEKAAGFQPVQVAENLSYEQYAAVSVRLPELPGVAPARGFSRFYPSGCTVAHLIGYVGAASAKDYEARKDPLLITPGFKIGKDGLEKTLDLPLTGKPGAKRVEVTARGKVVRELTTRPDTPGNTIKLTIDSSLQEFAGRRIGIQSGSVIIINCMNGDILALTSMPAFNPNSFSDGISHDEWGMLSENDHLPLLNKAMQGLYPPGSTFKPVTAIALQSAGVDPEETIHCSGGYQLGNRRFACLGRHGPMNLHRAIAQSCNTYFYTMGRRIGIERISSVARTMGFGGEFALPMPSQKYGTVPDAAWKKLKYEQEWSQADTLNTSIGQGYLQVTPMQLAMLAAHVASGKKLIPRLVIGKYAAPCPLPFPPEYLAAVRSGMDEVVNGNGTAGRSKLPLKDIRLAGKTGTAQVRNFKGGWARKGSSIPRKYRDHGLFIGFAPADNPCYAAAAVIEHGQSGSGAAAPVASDCLLYLFDQAKALQKLSALEVEWGGAPDERLAKDMDAYRLRKQIEAAVVRGEAPPVRQNAGENASAPSPASALATAESPVPPQSPPPSPVTVGSLPAIPAAPE